VEQESCVIITVSLSKLSMYLIFKSIVGAFLWSQSWKKFQKQNPLNNLRIHVLGILWNLLLTPRTYSRQAQGFTSRGFFYIGSVNKSWWKTNHWKKKKKMLLLWELTIYQYFRKLCYFKKLLKWYDTLISHTYT